MKNERSILVFASISLLALAIFTSYHTPSVDRSYETEYLFDIVNYKREAADRISIDNRRMVELYARIENRKSVGRKDEEDEFVMLQEQINALKTKINNYEANGLEEWVLFKEKFENDLTELHESLINLIVKDSNNLNNNSIQSFVKP